MREIETTILKNLFIAERTQFTHKNNNFASFDISYDELRENSDTTNKISPLQLLLNFIAKNHLPLEKRTLYILKYWAYEIEMINTSKSFRSTLEAELWDLTNPTTLNLILNQCEKMRFTPSIHSLFNFLENTNTLKHAQIYFSPPKPTYDEIQKFVTQNAKLHSENEIKKSSRTLGIFYRNKTTLFSNLSDDINIQIASLTGNPYTHDEETAIKIATENFESTHKTKRKLKNV